MKTHSLIQIFILTVPVSVRQSRYTYSDMLKILTQFRGAGDHLLLSDPLLQLIHLSVELVEPVLLLQAALSLLHQVLERHVQTVNLGLTSADVLAVKKRDAISVLATVNCST